MKQPLKRRAAGLVLIRPRSAETPVVAGLFSPETFSAIKFLNEKTTQP